MARQASLSGPTTRRFLPAALGATDDDEDGSIDTPLPLNKFQAASHLYRQVCRSVVSVDKSTKTRHVSPNESEESCPTTVWPCGLPLGMKQGVDGEPSHTCQRLGHEPRRAHQIPRDPAAQATPERLDHGPRRAHRIPEDPAVQANDRFESIGSIHCFECGCHSPKRGPTVQQHDLHVPTQALRPTPW